MSVDFARGSAALVFTILALTGLTPLGARAQNQPQTWTQTGMLSCKLNPSVGFTIVGHHSMECRFVPSTLGPKQFYEGALNTVGIDIGVVGTGGLNRAVLAPTAGVHDWQGTYVGASGDTALGAGVALDVTLGLSAPSTAMGGPVSRIGTVETVCVWCGHR